MSRNRLFRVPSSNFRALSLSLLLSIALVGCSRESYSPDAAAGAETAADSVADGNEPAPPAAAASDAPFEPVTSRQSAGLGQSVQAPGLSFDIPAGWQREPPTSSMRLAQAEIPGSAGSGQLTVFFFGPGGGGGVEANLERWAGQVELDPGETPIRDTFNVGELRVTWIDVTGTLKPSTMGTGPSSPQPDSRLLGAVIEGPGGPWFFKATGPAATLGEQRTAFIDMLKTARPAS